MTHPAHTLRLVLGDQLNPEHSWFQTVDPQVVYVLMEVRQETDYVLHHAQKILAIFAAMRDFSRHLSAAGHQVHYLALDDPSNKQNIPENLAALAQQCGAQRLEWQSPDEWRLDDQLRACLTIEETYPLMAQIMRQLAPQQGGALYIVDGAQSRATTAASWGTPAEAAQPFAVEDCWALRLGELHVDDVTHRGRPCPHLLAAAPQASMCMPLWAQGRSIGLLSLCAPDEASAQSFSASIQQLARVVADSGALTWANLALRATLREQAIRDPLTGLFNRRFMEESLTRELHRAARNRQSVGVIMMDIDGFKQINDRFGHEAGDGVLRAIGQLLQTATRGSDIPCRYGGEEFLLILPEASLVVTHARAEQIRERCRQIEFNATDGKIGPVPMSLGVAAYPQHGDALEVVLRAADAALYQAKVDGRDRTALASP